MVITGRRPRPLAAALALALAAAGGAALDDPSRAGDDPVARIRLTTPRAGRVDWAPQGDRIAYDRFNADGYSELWVGTPEGTGERCLTCEPLDFRKRHNGEPCWHPSGRYLVFRSAKPFREGGRPLPFQAIPGRNLGDDLWVITDDGRSFTRLTNRGERGGRVLSPRFSHEGDLLVWSERVASGAGAWGEWVLRVGRFTVKRGLPRLEEVKTYTPGSGAAFYESYGFTTDDRGILFGANLEPGQSESGMDLYLLRLETGETQRLTRSLEDWDRHARLAPNGSKIVWATSCELSGDRRPIGRRERSAATGLDLWMMNADGSGAQRLTRFNDPLSADYAGPMMVLAAAWSPTGDRLLVSAAPLRDPSGASLYLVELDRPYGR